MTQDDDELTDNNTLRWEWLASIVAGATLLSFLSLIVLSTFGIISLTLPETWMVLYAGLIITAGTFTFGDKFASWRGE